MKKTMQTAVLWLGIICLNTAAYADDFDTSLLPRYVVVTAENTKLIGGMNIIVYSKKSRFKSALQSLEEHLQSELKLRNMTDLLNTMDEMGFEFIQAYNTSAGTLGAGGGDDLEIFGSESKIRSNLVFRKKE